ncbi:ComEA family DNA-binding protein [Calothrix sp. UHCC 0171]|uniref:ComEA family DNA-binding protein n=1 Tax=Calothrix sp. UHCC 0171 TaxID=3110245 RepID=UPI002B20EEAC|nr:ComEA family DNA-binding protein [Calothrix sp. UHCC 0171]MEA5571041.1 ComEA family DNA-binding protein [Calothrix sp. UHCC 0171]
MNSFRFNLRLQKLRNQILSNPYYRFQSGEEIAIASQLGIRIDANNATVDDWLRLPGLSIHQAKTLVELSKAGVKFYCVEDIAAALSLSPVRFEYFQAILTFDYYDDEAIEIATKFIQINTATVEVLANTPFMDLLLAEAVVKNRVENGLYRDIVDFQRRLNLPGDVLAQLMYYLKF